MPAFRADGPTQPRPVPQGPGGAGVVLLTLLAIGIPMALFGSDAATDGSNSTPFADHVVHFQVGSGGGQGADQLPGIVLGPPRGAGRLMAGRDVLSLGQGGVIVLEFVDNEVFDGDGPDFIVFENPFLAAPGNDPDFGFFELARVEVSPDGIEWTPFPYDTASRAGCAGHHPVLANVETNSIPPTDPAQAGGDPFDLHDIGVERIRFVRLTDVLSHGGNDGSAGFDLDAVAAVHSRSRAKPQASPLSSPHRTGSQRRPLPPPLPESRPD